MGRLGIAGVAAATIVLLISAASVVQAAPSGSDEPTQTIDDTLNGLPSPVPGADNLTETLDSALPYIDPGGSAPGTSPSTGPTDDPPAPSDPGDEAPRPPSPPDEPDPDSLDETTQEVIDGLPISDELRDQLFGPRENDPTGVPVQEDEPLLLDVTIVIYRELDDLVTTAGAHLADTARDAAKNLLGLIRGLACSLVACNDSGSSVARSGAETTFQIAAATQMAARQANLTLFAVAAATSAGTASLFPGVRRWLRLAGLALLSRIPHKDILKSDVRRTIHDIVKENPGIALNEIVDKLDLSRNAVAYHLAVFESETEIVSVKDGKYRRYFLNGGKYTNGAKIVVSALRNDKTLRVARYIHDNPGAIQKQVCEAIGTSPSATNWHIQRLEKVGLVAKHRQANTVQYFPGEVVGRYDLSEFGLIHASVIPAGLPVPETHA